MNGAGATVSVICATRHPGAIVAAAMAEVRDAVDEIVIAADSRVGEEDLGHYASVADRLVRFEFTGMNRSLAWLTSLARGDWLLALDGDEVAGAGLVAAIPELVRDRRIGQFVLPKRWCWPDAGSYLVDEPWGSDRDPRLFRNDQRTLLPGRPHQSIELRPPYRIVEDAPIYHLDLLISDTATRRTKAARKDVKRFGLLTQSGRPFNQAFYVPEDRRDPATLPAPEADRTRIERVVNANGSAPRPLDRHSIQLFTAEEVEARWASRTVADEAYRAKVELVDGPPRFTAGAPGHELLVRVKNAGSEPWPGGMDQPPFIRVGVRWRLADGTVADGARGFLPHPLEPGEETLLPLSVAGPPVPGPAELAIDLIHEHVRWFDTPAVMQVQVDPPAREQLAELEKEHGPRVPLKEVLELRARVGRTNALMAQPAPTAAEKLDEGSASVRRIVQGSQIGDWALDGPAIERLIEVVTSEKPAYVAEFGGGTSTLVLAALLNDLHGDSQLRLVSFDQDPVFAASTEKALAEEELAEVASVLVLPLGDSAGGPMGYELTDEARVVLRARPPDLVLVDGPTLDSGASRLNVLELIEPYAAPGALVLMDDALRDAELRVAAAWSEHEDAEVLGIRVAGKGLLEARLA